MKAVNEYIYIPTSTSQLARRNVISVVRRVLKCIRQVVGERKEQAVTSPTILDIISLERHRGTDRRGQGGPASLIKTRRSALQQALSGVRLCYALGSLKCAPWIGWKWKQAASCYRAAWLVCR